jgi:4a-hydroxytetrahydrobiopterin dehydratase
MMTLLPQWANQSLVVLAASVLLLMGSASVAASSRLMRLSEAEVSDRLQQLPGWIVRDQQLVCTYQFSDFVEAIAFVNRVVDPV